MFSISSTEFLVLSASVWSLMCLIWSFSTFTRECVGYWIIVVAPQVFEWHSVILRLTQKHSSLPNMSVSSILFDVSNSIRPVSCLVRGRPFILLIICCRTRAINRHTWMLYKKIFQIRNLRISVHFFGVAAEAGRGSYKPTFFHAHCSQISWLLQGGGLPWDVNKENGLAKHRTPPTARRFFHFILAQFFKEL